MKIIARGMADHGKVVCPIVGEWVDLEHCAGCEYVRAVRKSDSGTETVVCSPEVSAPAESLELMIRAGHA